MADRSRSGSGLVLSKSDPAVASVLDGLDSDVRLAMERAIVDAYDAGSRDAEDRSAQFVARCVSALIGLPMPDRRRSAREMMGRLRSVFSARG